VPETPPANEDSSALIIGVVTGAGVFVFIVAVSVVFVLRRGRQREIGYSSDDEGRNRNETIMRSDGPLLEGDGLEEIPVMEQEAIPDTVVKMNYDTLSGLEPMNEDEQVWL
jgi:hypothetical protein